MIEHSLVLDVGSRTEKIVPEALSVDVNPRVRPEVCASVEYLPFRDKIFDCATYLELVEHLEPAELDQALDEASRVSRCLVLSTPNTDSLSWRIVWYFWSRTFGREWNGAHKSNLTKESVCALLKRHSFEISDTTFTRWSLLLRAEAKARPKMVPLSPIPVRIRER